MTPHLGRHASYGLAPLARAGFVTPRRFVIYCPPRTGSTLLATLLDSLPGVHCEGELLAQRVARPLAYFDGRSARARLLGQQAWGCKVISQHLRWHAEAYGGERFLDHLVDRGYTLLILRRRDWLLQALSAAHAARTRYHFTAADRSGFEAMRVDPVEVLSLLLTMEQEDEVVSSVAERLPHLELWYEDDLLTPDGQADVVPRVTSALGLRAARATSELVAVAPPTFTARVVNADEVAELLAPTRFARFLDREAYEQPV